MLVQVGMAGMIVDLVGSGQACFNRVVSIMLNLHVMSLA